MSADFLDVENRAKNIASAEVKGAQLWSAAIAAMITILLSLFTTFLPRQFDRYAAVESSIKTINATLSVDKLNDRIETFEAEIKRLQAPSAGPSGK